MSTSQNARTALLEQLVQFAPDALLVIDSRGQIVLANSTAETLFGFEPGELSGQPIERLVPQRLHTSHVRHRADYSDKPRTREMGARVADLVAARKDESEFPVEIRLSPLQVEGETLIAAAIRDVTERRRAAHELRAARQEAERANRAKSRFLAMASHDLRQPLQALQLFNAALRRQATELSTQEMLAHEADALDSMGKLLNALLDISKLEAGTIRPELEVVNMAELCRALHQQFSSVAAARGLRLNVDAQPHHLRTDRTLFRQLLENLLANAVKYTDTGAVGLVCRADAAGLDVTVSDTGIGIADEHLANIFDDFYQVRRTGGQGVGLGLAIVKRIALLLGMQVEVHSQLQHGTKFTVHIPAALLCDAPATPRASQDASAHGVSHRATILLIEDDAAVRNATSFYLKTVGHSVAGAESIEEAERAIATLARNPDLILSDYHLGHEQTGIEAIARIRSLCKSPLPALLLSGDTSAALRAIAHVERCQVLSKPIDDRSLTAAIEELLKPS